MMRRILVALAALGMVAACSSPPAATTAASPAAVTARPAPARSVKPRPKPTPMPPPAPPPPRVTVTRMRMADGAVVTVAVFRGPVTYVLHDGSEDPGLAAGRRAAVPGQVRPADQFLLGWARDFVTVLAPGPA
jgi:hypothetical protein